jgi:5-oxopent-3-ene-1,2,5-tricarboxylate decarboxylase / 2-hydroxyhepta-2,4-diene-1,7-dioate isomerase
MKPITQVQTVYGSLMHHSAQLQAVQDVAHQSPYNAPPKAPVLYIKPANTFSAWNGQMPLPSFDAHLRARACIGLIYIKNKASPLASHTKYAIKNIVIEDWRIALFADFTLAQESFYRPPVKFNGLDGSLGMAAESHPLQSWASLDQLHLQTWINGVQAHSYTSADWLCTALAQLQVVSDFIAFEHGDVLMMGCPPDAPRVHLGDVVEVRCEGMNSTRTTVVEPA